MKKLGSDRSGLSPSSRPIRRAKSCTRCRQAKLACDARKTVTGPCSRCKSKGLDCRFDENFQRVSTRRLVEEISNELHASRSVGGTSRGGVSALRSTPNLQALPANQSAAEESAPLVSNGLGDALSWLGTTDGDRACSYSLGTLTLEGQTVMELFQYFHVHYYPHAIFLQPMTSISDLISRSPLLFWTIVLVSSHGSDHFTPVYHQAATQHEELLSPILRKAIHRIETIHALLLLCLWPTPQSQYFQNPSWNYVGLAMHAAMQLHCHSPLGPAKQQHGWPGFGLAAEGEVDSVDQARTWLGCFRMGTTVAIFSGMPSPFSTQQHMRSIDKALRTASGLVPPSWDALFSILKITNSAIDTLGSTEDQTLHFSSIIQMFVQQLDELKQASLDSWSSELEVEWCNAKLYIYALTFITPIRANSSQSTQEWIHRQRILQKTFEVATNLITQFMKLGQLDASNVQPGGILKSTPELYFTSLFNATAFLFRFMATFMTPTPTQASRAVSLIIEAHKIFYSRPEHREFTRAAIHIEAFIDILKQGAPSGMSELAVRNKLGASVMFDAVFHACRHRNVDPGTLRPLAMGEWRTVNETFAQRLPKTPAQKRENETGATVVEGNRLEASQQFIALSELNSQWWEEWDEYIDLSQIRGDESDWI